MPLRPPPIRTDSTNAFAHFSMRVRVPKILEEDPELAMMASAPSRALADRFFKTVISKWSRDEWRIAGVERVHEFRDRVETALTQAISHAQPGSTICCVTSAGPIGVHCQAPKRTRQSGQPAAAQNVSSVANLLARANNCVAQR